MKDQEWPHISRLWKIQKETTTFHITTPEPSTKGHTLWYGCHSVHYLRLITLNIFLPTRKPQSSLRYFMHIIGMNRPMLTGPPNILYKGLTSKRTPKEQHKSNTLTVQKKMLKEIYKIMHKVPLEIKVAGLHSQESKTVYNYKEHEFCNRLALRCIAFNQSLYQVDKDLNVIEEN